MVREEDLVRLLSNVDGDKMKPKFKIELRPSAFLKWVVFPVAICVFAGALFMEAWRKKEK